MFEATQLGSSATGGSRAGVAIRAVVVSALLGLAVPIGCGDGGGRRPVSGRVSLDSEPLAEGFVLFEPAPGQEGGLAVGGSIRSGRFAIPGRDGPTPGSYSVRIYASSGVQASPAPGESPRSPRPMIDLIPGRYNERTELAATVTPDGPNEYRFELIGEPAPPSPEGE
ncbi:hypothetical protein ElP_01720 [Tautonia plasticadhaerens]|uniref:Uncharacterized protein n=2 Tax=Tautonia plasticadhaerens TaxID=2527974 RepID=A0A518GUT5_9BACT|nr:hypothetical protein ElP_01720 [Tautonia plasticadhaerens]